jgi:hypothetical protein
MHLPRHPLHELLLMETDATLVIVALPLTVLVALAQTSTG